MLETLCHVMQENIYRNFGMPQPNGYRKALRFMQHADKYGFPIITFVDTPGAFAGKTAEDLGQVTQSQLHVHSHNSISITDHGLWW